MKMEMVVIDGLNWGVVPWVRGLAMVYSQDERSTFNPQRDYKLPPSSLAAASTGSPYLIAISFLPFAETKTGRTRCFRFYSFSTKATWM